MARDGPSTASWQEGCFRNQLERNVNTYLDPPRAHLTHTDTPCELSRQLAIEALPDYAKADDASPDLQARMPTALQQPYKCVSDMKVMTGMCTTYQART